MTKFKTRIKLYISLLVAIAVAVATVIFVTAYKNQDIVKSAIISGSIGGVLILTIIIFFLVDRHNCLIFLKGNQLEFVIKKFYYDKNNDPIGYDFELLDEPGVLYVHRNAIVPFYGLEPDILHGYAYALDNVLEVDDASLFKIQKEHSEEENSWDIPEENEVQNEESQDVIESDEDKSKEIDSPSDSHIQKDYNDDVVIVDDDPAKREIKDPVEKIVDQDGDDDWSRAI